MAYRGGDLQRAERIDDGAEADERVLEHLARLGSDATTPCLATHFLYIPTVAGADAIAGALRDDGWRTSVGAVDDKTWLVVASQFRTLDPSSVRRTRRRLESLAADHGGLYDGWQATVA